MNEEIRVLFFQGDADWDNALSLCLQTVGVEAICVAPDLRALRGFANTSHVTVVIEEEGALTAKHSIESMERLVRHALGSCDVLMIIVSLYSHVASRRFPKLARTFYFDRFETRELVECIQRESRVTSPPERRPKVSSTKPTKKSRH